MARYVLAQWDYTAEGNFELSFKEGDKIKLLEKHNDDWWEGELNDEIGFFPANRTKVYSQDEQQQQGIDLVKKASVSSTTSSSSVASRTMTTSGNSVQHKNAPTTSERSMLLAAGSNNSTPHNSNPYHQQQVQQQATSVKEIGNHRESVSAPPAMPRVTAVNENILVDISTENESKDNETAAAADPTTALFFNAAAATSDHHQDIKSPLQDAAPSAAPPNLLKRLQDMDMNEKPVYDIQKLNLEALHPNWIRIQGSMQIKVVSSTTGETQLPWKDYYGVLSHGFLLVYKEGLHKLGRRPSSMKPVPAYFTIDLNSSDIKPATKSDTRKKHAFIINLLLAHHQYTVLVHVQNESLFAEWLDAMMRDMIHVKEHTEEQDVDLVQLLASIPLQHILEPTTATTTTMTAISTDDTATEDPSLGTTTGGGGAGGGGSKSLTRWFSRSSRNNSVHRSQTLPTPSAVSSTASASTAIHQGHDAVFGGPLKLEPDGQIPLVVRLCIQQVDQRGLDVVGIYRLSGQTTSIQKYKAMFNSTTTDPQQQQQQASIMHQHLEQEHDINVITGLLKLYFRQLKNPLLTFEYYDRFIEAARLQDYDERMFRLKSIIQVLPVVNYKVLYHVARHLERVKENSHINKMEASNLALIFSMGLLRPKHDDVSASIMHNDLSSTIVETIITHVDWFFDTDTTSTTTATSTITTDEEEDNASSVLVHENTQ